MGILVQNIKRKNIMTDLTQLLSELLSFSGLDNVDIKVVDDGEGNITIKYNSPKNNPVVEQIKKELEAIEDDIFVESSEIFIKQHKDAYEIMADIDRTTDIEALKQAYQIFKTCVKEVVENKVKSLTAEVNRLFNKYLDTKE
jgi:hypothetical protein